MLVMFLLWSVALYTAETWTLRRSEQKRLEAFETDVEKDGISKIDIQNKKFSCAGKSGRWKNNGITDKEEEKKLAGPLAKKELSAEGCSRLQGSSTRGPRAACGPRASIVWPGKGISQSTMHHEY